MRRMLVPFLMLASASALLLVLSLAWFPAGPLSIPLTWPAIFIIGPDETTERFGRYGELIVVWFCSLPTAMIYSSLWAWAKRKALPSPSI